MICRFCDGIIRCVSTEQRTRECHRWYRCNDCGKSIHTAERYVSKGPAIGSKKTGAIARGSRNGASVLTDDNILDIRKMAASGVLQKDIAKIYGITPAYVSRIVNRKAWVHI